MLFAKVSSVTYFVPVLEFLCWICLQNVLNDVLDSEFQVLSDSEYGEEEEDNSRLRKLIMINEAFDSDLDDIDAVYATRYSVYFVLNNFPL